MPGLSQNHAIELSKEGEELMQGFGLPYSKLKADREALLEALKLCVEGLQEEARDNKGAATPKAYEAQIKALELIAKAEGE